MIDLTVFPFGSSWRTYLGEDLIYEGSLPHAGAAQTLLDAGIEPGEQLTTRTMTGTPVFVDTVERIARMMDAKEKKP